MGGLILGLYLFTDRLVWTRLEDWGVKTRIKSSPRVSPALLFSFCWMCFLFSGQLDLVCLVVCRKVAPCAWGIFITYELKNASRISALCWFYLSSCSTFIFSPSSIMKDRFPGSWNEPFVPTRNLPPPSRHRAQTQRSTFLKVMIFSVLLLY